LGVSVTDSECCNDSDSDDASHKSGKYYSDDNEENEEDNISCHSNKSINNVTQSEEVNMDELELNDDKNYRKSVIKNKDEVIPLNLIGKNTGQSYDYIDGNNAVYIINPGLYRITYNITYHGSIYDFISTVRMTDESDPDNKKELNHVMHSYNISRNRPYEEYDNNDDKSKDKKYTSMKNIDRYTKIINHSFYLLDKKRDDLDDPMNVSYKLSLCMKKYSKNVGKKLYIHPITTWMCVEKVSE
jgi:hypothetical protein